MMEGILLRSNIICLQGRMLFRLTGLYAWRYRCYIPETLWTGLVQLMARDMPATGSRNNAVNIISLRDNLLFLVEKKS